MSTFRNFFWAIVIWMKTVINYVKSGQRQTYLWSVFSCIRTEYGVNSGPHIRLNILIRSFPPDIYLLVTSKCQLEMILSEYWAWYVELIFISMDWFLYDRDLRHEGVNTLLLHKFIPYKQKCMGKSQEDFRGTLKWLQRYPREYER